MQSRVQSSWLAERSHVTGLCYSDGPDFRDFHETFSPAKQGCQESFSNIYLYVCTLQWPLTYNADSFSLSQPFFTTVGVCFLLRQSLCVKKICLVCGQVSVVFKNWVFVSDPELITSRFQILEYLPSRRAITWLPCYFILVIFYLPFYFVPNYWTESIEERVEGTKTEKKRWVRTSQKIQCSFVTFT